MSELAVLEQTTCLQLTFRLWSGTRRLTKEDLGSAADDLPPEDLASRGTLKLCNPKLLAPIANVKRAAERDCEQECVSFLRGYATHDFNVEALARKLDERKRQFASEVATLTDELPAARDEWVQAHQTWRHVIEREIPNAESIAARYSFTYEFFRVGAPKGEGNDALSSGLIVAAQGLSGQLFREIEAEATLAFKRSFENRDSVGRKAVKPLRRILRKLDALRYLDPRCATLSARIETVLAGLPKLGPIGEPHLSALVGLLAVLGCAQAGLASAPASASATPPGTADLFGPGEDGDEVDGDSASEPATTPAVLDSEESGEDELPVPRPRPEGAEAPAALWI